ncbi:MAG: YigZ family protein, partial [Neisseriaceae bacterium]|nr:YigZ family protein [Neisseriaceae bacterium]
PAGSAGRPILGQIDSFQLTDIAVIVVRYFGGTLLGVPGLIHAYKTATAEALKKASIITKNIEKTIHLECAYEVLNTVLQIIRRHQGNIIHQDLQLSCRIQARIPVSHYENCRQQLLDTRAVTILE